MKKSFNELRSEAKGLGINTKGLNAAQIEQAIADKAVVVIVGEKEGDVAKVEEDLAANPEAVAEKVERRGRPVNANSERQKRLAGYEAKKEAGVEVKRGRPANGDSERQKRIAARNEKIANGVEIKRGRPMMAKPEPEVEAPKVEVVVETPKAKDKNAKKTTEVEVKVEA